MSKIIIPENYEEALKRKEEVLNIINEYSIALLNETELPCSEEEIELLQQEYALLDEYVELTSTEKEAISKSDKTKYNEEVLEDGTINKVEVVSFWDKVNPFIFVYGIVAVIGSLWFAIQGIGIQFINIFTDMAVKHQWDLSTWTDSQINWLLASMVVIYPILFVIISFFVARFACRNKETRKVGYITLLVHFVVAAINTTIIVVRILGLN